jgi:hypothetical protein
VQNPTEAFKLFKGPDITFQLKHKRARTFLVLHLQEIFREFTCGIDVQIYLPAMSFMGGI